MLIIANGQIWGQQITNHSFHKIRGIEQTFGVVNDADIDAARKVIDDV